MEARNTAGTTGCQCSMTVTVTQQFIYYTTIRVEKYFDANKLLEKVCTTVLLHNSRWEEQHDNKLIPPQEVKLCCGIRDVNTLWGPESKSYNLLWQAIFIQINPRLWLMNFVQIFRKVPEEVQRLTLAVWNFDFKRKQYENP